MPKKNGEIKFFRFQFLIYDILKLSMYQFTQRHRFMQNVISHDEYVPNVHKILYLKYFIVIRVGDSSLSSSTP